MRISTKLYCNKKPIPYWVYESKWMKNYPEFSVWIDFWNIVFTGI